MEIAIRELLPKMAASITFQVSRHQCKAELLARLGERLAGYRKFLPESHRILVLVDRDNDDCHALKQRLEDIAAFRRFSTITNRGPEHSWTVANRIVIEELESWYFGDWDAVRAVYPRVPATIPRKAPFRDPDAIGGGTWECFERVMQSAGYFKGGLRKLEAARAISPQLVPDRNSSRSFRAMYNLIKSLRAA